MAFALFQRIARAAVKHGVKFLLNLVPGGDAVYEMATDVWEDYRRDRQDAALRAELQAAAGAPAEQVRQEAEAAVQAEAAGQPPEVQLALVSYLSQVPASIRRSLRRPSDPSGTTVPATLSLSRPQDLVPLLPPRPPRFKVGDRPVSGRVLDEPLGIGGFGEAWKARSAHLLSKAPTVLKFCLDAAAAPALRNEAGVLDRVMQHGRHPGIVPLLDAHLDCNPPCLEYAYVEGGDLGGLIQEMHARGKTNPDGANRLLLQLAEIIASVHRLQPPIVHCDLKPANILVRRTTDGKVSLYVTDFGIGGLATVQAVRESRQPTRSRQELLTEAVRGAYTPLYASLEQMTRPRNQPPDPRDDVHALGVIWFQLLTGDLGILSIPSDWREQVEERGLSADLTKLLASCIASKAEKRPASAVVLAERLSELLSPAAVTPPPAIPVMQPMKINLGKRKPAPPPQRRPGMQPMKINLGKRKPAPPPQRRPGEIFTNSLGMRFAWCPPGTFLMGSPPSEPERDDDEQQHRVTLSKGFWLGVTPVTQAQWQAVLGSNPSHFKGDDRPVEKVSWDDCQEFCKKLAERDGKRYRLPTEAEWEYACRAGTTTPFHFGATISTDQANYDGNYTYGKGKKGKYREETTPVGSFPANAWGLYDMHGNVLEWCQDWHGPYPSGDIKDPQGPNNGDARVLRGGSWYFLPRRCRSADRGGSAAASRIFVAGCRLVLFLD
jgi:formylglycine-generating enzyme required for sulfatase activity